MTPIHWLKYTTSKLPDIEELPSSVVLCDVEKHVREPEAERDPNAQGQDEIFCQLRTCREKKNMT